MTYSNFYGRFITTSDSIWMLNCKVEITTAQFESIAKIRYPDRMGFVGTPIASSSPTLIMTSGYPQLALNYEIKGNKIKTVTIEVDADLYDLITKFKAGRIAFNDLLDALEQQQQQQC